jgi:hypothetical protein
MRKRTNINTLDKQEIIRLYTEYVLPSTDIAEIIGCSSVTILKILKSANVKIVDHRPKPSGAKNPCWKGGRRKSNGYILIYSPNYHRAINNYVSEHLLVWEQSHNKKLPDGWIIHHLNGIKNDNRIENLVAMPRKSHIHLGTPYKKRIRELEAKISLLKRVLEDKQMIFYIGEKHE